MGSQKIGDYIHAHLENYQNFGTTQEGPSDYEDSQRIINETMSQYKNKKAIQGRNLKQLEIFLNALLYKPEAGKEQIDSEVWKKIEPLIHEAFQQKWNGYDFGSRLGVYNTKLKGKNITLQRANEIITSLNQTVNSLDKNTDTNGIITKINDIANQLKELVKQANKQGATKIQINDDNFKNAINQALGLISFNLKMVGDAFEIWLNGVNQALQSGIDTTVEQIAQTLGSQTSKTGVNIDQFSTIVNMKTLAEKTKMSYQDNTTRIESKTPSQDKADVQITWQGSPLMISAKNYKLADSKLVNLVSGTNLFMVLLNESPGFVNHILNITTLNDSNLQQAHDAIKVITLWKAITGEGLGKSGAADVFILNNRSRQHIYVLDVASLYQRLIKNIDANVIFNFDPGLTSLSDANEFVGDKTDLNQTAANIRITNLLAKLHAYKVGVKFDTTNVGLTK